MTPLNTFVRAVRRHVYNGFRRPALLGVYAGRESVLYYADHPWYHSLGYLCVVYIDGSAQLLSRDEDECRLFATLWELER